MCELHLRAQSKKSSWAIRHVHKNLIVDILLLITRSAIP